MTSTPGGTLGPGTFVGNKRFKIIKSLGAGGFGETYLAEDTHDFHSQTALKRFSFVSSDPTTFKKAEDLFKREAKILRDLTDNFQTNFIPKYKGYLSENQELYLVQEYIEGVTLGNELERNKQFNEDEITKLLGDVLNALHFIHSKRVIHRDIKPENLIRRNSDGQIVLIDFGAVKQEVTNMVAPATQIYSEGYAPPEQKTKPRFSSDIYALGMTALEALTGLQPEHLKDTRTGKVLLPPQVPVHDKLKRILARMVEDDYKRRYQSAEEVLRDLQSAGFKTTVVVSPGKKQTVIVVISQLPVWLRFVIATPLVAMLAFAVPLMVRSIFMQPSGHTETQKREETQSPTTTTKPTQETRSPKPEPRQGEEPTSPKPSPDADTSDCKDDIFCRPPGR